MILDDFTYRKIYAGLNSYEDISRLAKEYNYYDEELFLVIYTQKKVREVTARFYKIKAKADKLEKEWKSGKSFLEISDEKKFPPVMTAFIILTNNKMGKKTFRKILRNQKKVKSKRLKREIEEIKRTDHIYSPKGYQVQRVRGEQGEERLRDGLDCKGIEFEREEDLRRQGGKTPDFLLKKPIYYRGEKVVWIESKATFADDKEFKKNLNKQLSSYREIFGQGMVIYWFGIVDTIPTLDGIVVETEEVLRDHWDF